eukprot:4994703-Karenia_brevis.AAC.1
MLGVSRDTGQRIAPRPHPLEGYWRVRRPPEWIATDYWRVRRPPEWIASGRLLSSRRGCPPVVVSTSYIFVR